MSRRDIGKERNNSWKGKVPSHGQTEMERRVPDEEVKRPKRNIICI